MNRFMGLMAVLYRTLGLDSLPRMPSGMLASKVSANVVFVFDIELWDPSKPNQDQHPHTWTCVVTGPDGRKVHGSGCDGAVALAEAIASAAKPRPKVVL